MLGLVIFRLRRLSKKYFARASPGLDPIDLEGKGSWLTVGKRKSDFFDPAAIEWRAGKLLPAELRGEGGEGHGHLGPLAVLGSKLRLIGNAGTAKLRVGAKLEAIGAAIPSDAQQDGFRGTQITRVPAGADGLKTSVVLEREHATKMQAAVDELLSAPGDAAHDTVVDGKPGRFRAGGQKVEQHNGRAGRGCLEGGECRGDNPAEQQNEE